MTLITFMFALPFAIIMLYVIAVFVTALLRGALQRMYVPRA